MQSWFQDAVLGYAILPDFAGSIPSYKEPLHAHWHSLIIINQGVVFDDVKMRVFEHMKSILGDRIKWDSDKYASCADPDGGRNWDQWMEPVRALTPRGDGSFYWASSHEVYSCPQKGDHKNPKGTPKAFQSLFDRPEEDLQVIMPLYRDGLLDGKFGGVLLDSGISMLEDGNDRRILPSQSRAASSKTRWVFRRLVRSVQGAAAVEMLKRLVGVPSHMSVEQWEAEVIRNAKERGVIG